MADLKKFTEQLIEAYNKRKLDQFDALLADDVILVRDGEKAHGLKEFKNVLERVQKAFPDIQYKIFDQVVAGDRIVLRWEAKGTHKGEYLGVAATNRPITYTGMTLFELVGDKIKKVFVAADLLSLLRTLKQKPAGPEEARS